MLSGTFTLTIIIVILALTFDFINGFHDSANAIATCVSTRVLSMRQAVLMSAIFDFIGAFTNVKVAQTIGKGLINPESISQNVVIVGLVSAIIWNVFTWYFGLPSSSSHALIGGLIGSAIAFSKSLCIINWSNFFWKVVLWLFLSPIIGFIAGYIFMSILNIILRKQRPATVTKIFSKAQVVSAMMMALNHGSNDAQKSMGVITMALMSGGIINEFHIPLWVKISCATAMALGITVGGEKIIKTMGHNIAKLTPVNGFAAETGAAAVIFTATMFNAPVSTTHIISTSIMGVSASKRFSSVRWNIASNIVKAWVITIPVCVVIAMAITSFMKVFI
ncbi:inorganic phosphate transporter [Clostridium rectalis]|uniref:inorganic phosphate transporter n=1 Tax=Clostridium rectalis TaxID=2040295 RepID=UPI000F643E96|nr:inorganic phosphate transporter [Clostridium rectalis]